MLKSRLNGYFGFRKKFFLYLFKVIIEHIRIHVLSIGLLARSFMEIKATEDKQGRYFHATLLGKLHVMYFAKQAIHFYHRG